MSSQRDVDRLAIVDSNQLRSAGIASLLKDWATSHSLVVAEVQPEEVMAIFDQSPNWRLVVISLGSELVSATAVHTRLRVLTALAEDIPAVVWSDCDDPAEIVAAYRVACRGFIPTSMKPRLALQALSFILNGGTFFPPSALRLIESAVPGTPAKTTPSGGTQNTRGNLRDIGPIRSASENDCAGGKAQVADPPDEGMETPTTYANGGANTKLCGDLADVVEESLAADHAERSDGLTFRQHEVLRHLRMGQPNKIIARELGVTEGTVKVHVRQIMRKLGAANRTQAAVLCEREHSNGFDGAAIDTPLPHGSTLRQVAQLDLRRRVA